MLRHDQQQLLLDCLQHSKQLRLAQAEVPCTPDSRATSGSDVWHVPTVCTSPVASSNQGRCDDSTSCLLKQPRSLQHIAAANSTRQRILRSMSAGAAAPPPASATHPPIPVPQRAGSSKAVVQHSMYSSSTDSSASSSSFGLRSSSHGLPATSSSGRMPPTAFVAGQYDRSDESSSNIPFFDSHHSSSSHSHSGTRQVVLIPRSQQPQLGPANNAGVAAVDCAVPMAIDCSQQQRVVEVQADQQPSVAECAESAAAPAPWSDLPVEVMAQVARFMGNTVAAVAPLCRTCRSGRHETGPGGRLL